MFSMGMTGLAGTTALVGTVKKEIAESGGRMEQAAEIVADSMRKKTHSRRVRKAISHTVKRRGPGSFEAEIGPETKKAFFAKFLERGTSHSRAFPFAVPAAKSTEKEVVELVGIPPSIRGR